MTTHVVVLPGGGYSSHAAHEAEPIVHWLETLGYGAGGTVSVSLGSRRTAIWPGMRRWHPTPPMSSAPTSPCRAIPSPR